MASSILPADLRARSGISFQRMKVRDACFVEFTVIFFENVRLPDPAGSERPKEFSSLSLFTIGHRVSCRLIRGLDFVAIRSEGEITAGSNVADWHLRGVNRGSSHGWFCTPRLVVNR